MGKHDDIREKVTDSHSNLLDYVQREFSQLLAAVQEAELDLVRRCQGCHKGVTQFISERHQSVAGKSDPEFLRNLDNQAEELTRIVQTRFAELARDLKQCHGGGCQVMNRKVSTQIFEMSAGR